MSRFSTSLVDGYGKTVTMTVAEPQPDTLKGTTTAQGLQLFTIQGQVYIARAFDLPQNLLGSRLTLGPRLFNLPIQTESAQAFDLPQIHLRGPRIAQGLVLFTLPIQKMAAKEFTLPQIHLRGVRFYTPPTVYSYYWYQAPSTYNKWRLFDTAPKWSLTQQRRFTITVRGMIYGT